MPSPHKASITDAQGSDDAHRQAPVDRSDAVTGLDLLFSCLAQVDTHEPPADVTSPAKIPFEPIHPNGWADCLSAPDFEQEREAPPVAKSTPTTLPNKNGHYKQLLLTFRFNASVDGPSAPSPTDVPSSPATAGV
ncbi:unnamed protein product [Closterium sp. NIES-54]